MIKIVPTLDRLVGKSTENPLQKTLANIQQTLLVIILKKTKTKQWASTQLAYNEHSLNTQKHLANTQQEFNNGTMNYLNIKNMFCITTTTSLRIWEIRYLYL